MILTPGDLTLGVVRLNFRTAPVVLPFSQTEFTSCFLSCSSDSVGPSGPDAAAALGGQPARVGVSSADAAPPTGAAAEHQRVAQTAVAATQHAGGRATINEGTGTHLFSLSPNDERFERDVPRDHMTPCPQLENQDSVLSLLRQTESELSLMMLDAMRTQEDPLQRQRLLVEEERLKYLNQEELLIQQLQ